MAYELEWWPAADERMTALEAEGGPALAAVNQTLDRLEIDPFDRRLGTTMFSTDELRKVSATPTRHDNLYIFWQPGPSANVIDIVLIHDLPA